MLSVLTQARYSSWRCRWNLQCSRKVIKFILVCVDVIWCYVVSCRVMLCYVMLCYDILCYVILLFNKYLSHYNLYFTYYLSISFLFLQASITLLLIHTILIYTYYIQNNIFRDGYFPELRSNPSENLAVISLNPVESGILARYFLFSCMKL